MAFSDSNEKAPRLLVLGAGNDQCFMLRSAREMGVQTLAVDGDANAPGFALADDSVVISNRDVAAILGHLEQTNTQIDGVSTMGSDIPHVVAEIAHALKLPSIPQDAALIAVDKFRMKSCFSAAGICVPDYQRVNSLASLLPLLASWGQLVLKPMNQAGSRGVSLVQDEAGLENALIQAQRFSADGWVLAERFLPGEQLSSESLIVDGVVHTPGLADRNYADLDRFLPQILENGGWVPSQFASEQENVDEVISACAKALGIRNGVIKGDLVRAAEGRIAVIEVAARLSGGDFSESLVPLSSGVNYVKQVIRQALGLPVMLSELAPRRHHVVANRYFFAEPGCLVSVSGLEAMRAKPWVEKLELSFWVGDVLPRVESHGQRLGVFVVTGPDRETVQRRIEEVYAGVSFQVVNDPARSDVTKWQTVPTVDPEGKRKPTVAERARRANSHRLLRAAAQSAQSQGGVVN
ncbi:MAG: ATP-grasp domain-containing protein [Myxococcota bacterium]